MMIYTPEMNTGENIFCFGSNLSGRHGKGAAQEAFLHWGAIPGVGFGPMGHCWAIPTKGWRLEILSLDHIGFYVRRFKEYALIHPARYKFLITPVGTGLACYSHQEIAPLFRNFPTNCVMPDEWKGIL